MARILAWAAPPHGRQAVVRGRQLAQALGCELQVVDAARTPATTGDALALVVAGAPATLERAAPFAAAATCPVLHARVQDGRPAPQRALMVLPAQGGALDVEAALRVASLRELCVLQLVDEAELKAMQLAGLPLSALLDHLRAWRERLEARVRRAARLPDGAVRVHQRTAGDFLEALRGHAARLRPQLLIVPGRLPFSWRRPFPAARLRHLLRSAGADVLTIPLQRREACAAAWPVRSRWTSRPI